MKEVSINISDVELRTDRLLLRPFRQTDLDDFYRYARVDGVGQPAGWIPHENKDETQFFLNLYIEGKKALAIEMDGRLIGSINIEPPHHLERKYVKRKKARSIGYSLAKDTWGQGLMTEAVHALLQYLFEVVQLDLVIGSYIPDNKRSKRVLEKCGFKPLTSSEVTDQYGQVITLIDLAIDKKSWFASKS